MGRILLAAMLCAGLGASPASAQQKSTGGIPSDVATTIATLYNDPQTRRQRGSVDIPRDSVVPGTLAIRGGPVTLAGRITGSLIVINADVTFKPGATVDGQVYVVGGKVDGKDDATIGNDFHAYAETMRYRISDETLVVEEERMVIPDDDAGFWQGHRSEHTHTDFDLLGISGGNTYNRVEGLPILAGPRLRIQNNWGSVLLQARGIFRTAEPIEWDRGTVGHDARAEVRWGYRAGFGLGAVAFDRIDPVEGWQMGDKEAGLTAVAIHRDYRDYYSRHGGRGFARVYFDDDASLTFGYGEERWEARDARSPWTLFRDNQSWRPNPIVDDGNVRLLTAALNIDERTARYSPGAGWYIHADIERGRFEPTLFAGPGGTTSDASDYTRGFVDLRRYNRIAPHAQLNVRVAAGGWLAGDELPLQRRLSVSGPGTLPGFDFRSTPIGSEDRMACSESGGPTLGVPALCDRVALIQVEYRGDVSWHTSGNNRWFPTEFHSPTWSVFFDAGRGWRAKDDGRTTYAIESFPELNTFKSDGGIGLEFGSMSVSVAKSISDRKEPLNWVVRLSRRF